MQRRLTSPPSQLYPHPGHPSRGRVSSAQPGRGHRPMPGRWPGDHLRVSRPPARPARRTGRTGKSNRASNLKSQPVAFGISRPTRTTTEESIRLTPRWKGRRPRAGLQHTVARERPPSASYPRPHVRPPPLRRARGPQPSGLGRGAAAGPPGATRGPGDGPETTSGYRGLQPAQRWAENGTGIARLDARLSRPLLAAVGVVRRGQPLHGTLPTPQRRLTRTEPANHELVHPTRSAPPCSGSDFRINVPGDHPSPGTGTTSE
jgi:hypothetical protein